MKQVTSFNNPIEQNRLEEFFSSFPGDVHHLLAMYAAFPAVITPDLLHKIWLNFILSNQELINKDISRPYEMVSDVLLSPLFREMGSSTFEMYPEIKETLSSQLFQQFGWVQIIRLANFLKFYLQDYAPLIHHPILIEILRLNYQMYLEPEKVAQKLFDVFAMPSSGNWRQKSMESMMRQRERIGSSTRIRDSISIAYRLFESKDLVKQGDFDKARSLLKTVEPYLHKKRYNDKDLVVEVNDEVFELLNEINTERLNQNQLNKLDQLNERNKIKRFHLQNILNIDPIYNEEIIKKLVVEDIITVGDLIKETHLTEEDTSKIMRTIELDHSFSDWVNLPPLKKGRTDVYLFGIVGSGKSSLLAGVLHQAESKKILKTDSTNYTGAKYKEDLINRIQLGILPNSTSSDAINYISVSLIDQKGYPHHLSFIEMSGEKFSDTYKSGGISSESSIGAKQYLKNSNRKIIMFIIDYRHHIDGVDLSEMATQSAQLDTTLNLLSNGGILGKTDVVFIVVTKADLFSDQSNIKQATMNFLEEEYLNFLNNCKRMKHKHNFELIVHPFSLGHFVLPKTYRYNSTFSDNLVSDLISFSFFTRN